MSKSRITKGTKKHAATTKSTEATERAEATEPTSQKERADEKEAPEFVERAEKAEPTATQERAGAEVNKPPNQPERTIEQSRFGLRRKVRMLYDLQRLRMQCAARTQPKAEGGEIQLHEIDIAILEARAKNLAASEKDALRDVADHLKTIPFWNQVLSDKSVYKGIGPAMGGVLLAELDIRRANTPSAFWKFAGLAPVPAWRCKTCNEIVVKTDEVLLFKHRTKKKCGYRLDGIVRDDQIYASGMAARPTKGEKLPYNAWLRMKLVGVLAPILLKVGSPWKKTYDGYKYRLQSKAWGTSDGHRHNAAMRYMIKMLLLDIWTKWRAFEGLPVRPSYHEEKLGHVHGTTSGAPEVDEAVEYDPAVDDLIELERKIAEEPQNLKTP